MISITRFRNRPSPQPEVEQSATATAAHHTPIPGLPAAYDASGGLLRLPGGHVEEILVRRWLKELVGRAAFSQVLNCYVKGASR